MTSTLAKYTVVSITAVERFVIQVRKKILSPLSEKVDRKWESEIVYLEATALSTNIRLGLKSPLVANTLTYNTSVSITALERLVIQVREKILSPLYEKDDRK
jgi:hypothetical protein